MCHMIVVSNFKFVLKFQISEKKDINNGGCHRTTRLHLPFILYHWGSRNFTILVPIVLWKPPFCRILEVYNCKSYMWNVKMGRQESQRLMAIHREKAKISNTPLCLFDVWTNNDPCKQTTCTCLHVNDHYQTIRNHELILYRWNPTI